MTTPYPGGVSKHELEIRLKRLQADVKRLLARETDGLARRVALQVSSTALDSVDWQNINGIPDSFPPDPHNHTESEITDLDKYTQDEVDALLAANEVDLSDIDGGEADSVYVGLEAEGGDSATPVFTRGVLLSGGA